MIVVNHYHDYKRIIIRQNNGRRIIYMNTFTNKIICDEFHFGVGSLRDTREGEKISKLDYINMDVNKKTKFVNDEKE